ncbi:membrane protein [Gigaspora margarita]|uniref:Membrane protein n=1 Tax=Gigaspora margarita TaxID=4874 RepID=A0A8H4B0R1_GIGMA|nr:membrane protein [Gigaspora margarita]
MTLRVLFIFIFDVALPLILYFTLSYQIWAIWALLISFIPPIISIFINFIFRKQFDVIGMLSIIGIVSAIILVSFKNVSKFYSLGMSFIFGVIDLILVITLIPIKIGSFEMRPFAYYCSKNLGIGNYKGLTKYETFSERCERYWRNYALFRQALIIGTAVWGFVFLLELLIIIIIVCTKGSDYNDNISYDRVVYYTFPFLSLFNSIFSLWVKTKGFKEDNPNHDKLESFYVTVKT